MPQSFSHIQNQILTRLKNADTLRYTDLKVKGIPNDLFNYHLQFLVKKGYIEKDQKGYQLSDTGIRHVADAYPLNNTDASTNSLYKINVITIVSRKVKGKLEILNQIRKVNPSYGKVGVMGGVVRKGELILDAASRKLKVETGLDATFKLLGFERRIMYKDGDMFSDVLFPIAYADAYSGELIHTSYGENMWVPINKAIKNETADFDNIKKLIDVLKSIKKGTVKKMPLFYSEDIQIG